MCFGLSWYIRFAVICMAVVLSTCNEVGFVCEKSSSERRQCNQIISKHVADKDLYFVSIEDLDT